MVGVVGLGLVALWLPELVPSVPEPASLPAIAVLVVGLVFYGLLALRALHTVLLTRRRADLGVFVGLVWLAGALVPALMQSYLDLAWWLGHGLEVAGVLLVGAPVAADLFRSSPSRPLAGDLRGAEIVSAEEAFLGSQVGGLVRLLAEKDEYTEGHTRRVALLAVEVGEELGLPPARLRELATGGLLHDIGKLSVPDEVLKKPAALDDAEYALVQKHTVWGDALLGRLGFSPRIRRLVRDHHERLDGTGYPNGVTALSLRDARPRRLRRLRRPPLRPRLPRGVGARAGDRAAAGRGRHEVRPQVRRGAQPRPRPPQSSDAVASDRARAARTALRRFALHSAHAPAIFGGTGVRARAGSDLTRIAPPPLTLGGHGVEGVARVPALHGPAGAAWGKVGAPGECGRSHNTSVDHERLQSRRPGRLVAGRTHGQGSPFFRDPAMQLRASAGGGAREADQPSARARWRRATKNVTRYALSLTLPARLVARPRPSRGTPKGWACAQYRESSCRGELDTSLVPMVDDLRRRPRADAATPTASAMRSIDVISTGDLSR